jgi:ABC-type oligopeptide transport system ATPase subunit
MTNFLELRNVRKVFGSGLWRRKETVALDNVSLTINTDEPTVKAIAGESGSGLVRGKCSIKARIYAV